MRYPTSTSNPRDRLLFWRLKISLHSPRTSALVGIWFYLKIRRAWLLPPPWTYLERRHCLCLRRAGDEGWGIVELLSHQTSGRDKVSSCTDSHVDKGYQISWRFYILFPMYIKCRMIPSTAAQICRKRIVAHPTHHTKSSRLGEHIHRATHRWRRTMPCSHNFSNWIGGTSSPIASTTI